ncbi:hypothetical protein M9Y10_003799 [Tritrichomonas musculus]|uniref:Thioredoxin domain-containing protein n=1 Tax=Tritrichomonas musculus TaxID=1915356 RepID=A0ABR2JQL4_9EUKA
MLFHLLISLVFTTSIEITKENFDEIINNKEGKPIFIKLWATWCPHCRKMAPEWERLSEAKDLEGTVILAEIECEGNRELCKRFEGENFPRIYYINTKENLTTRYLGEREYDHFRMFIKKQQHFPLITVRNDINEISKYYEISNITTTFIFCFPEGDQNALKQSQEIVMKHRHYESQFLWLNTNEDDESKLFDFKDHKNKIIAITNPNRTVEYNGSFDDPQVSLFLLTNSIPFLNNFTGAVMKHTDYEKSAAFIIMHKNSTDRSNFSSETIEISEFASKYYIVATASCAEQKWLCLYTSILDKSKNNVDYLIFDRGRRLFWVYRNDDQSSTNVEKWIEKVFNNKVRSEGPGRGLFGPFMESFYDRRAGGEDPSLAPLIFLPFLLILIVYFVLYDIYNSKKSKRSKEHHHKHHHHHSE